MARSCVVRLLDNIEFANVSGLIDRQMDVGMPLPQTRGGGILKTRDLWKPLTLKSP